MIRNSVLVDIYLDCVGRWVKRFFRDLCDGVLRVFSGFSFWLRCLRIC